MKRAALVGLLVLVFLLAVTVFYWIEYQEVAAPGRVVYRVNRSTGEVTTVRTQVVARGHVLDPAPAGRMTPQHVLPSATEQMH